MEKQKLGETKYFRLRVPKYFTSHSKPERLRKYFGLNKIKNER